VVQFPAKDGVDGERCARALRRTHEWQRWREVKDEMDSRPKELIALRNFGYARSVVGVSDEEKERERNGGIECIEC
jgi:hypothetical protein